MNVCELDARLGAWHDRTARRLALLPWWGRPIELAFGVVSALVIIPAIFVVTHVATALLWAPFLAVCVFVSRRTGASVEDTVIYTWSAFLASCVLFGIARWAVRKGRATRTEGAN